NCSLGAAEMRPFLADLARASPFPVVCYPNAGLPNAFGAYDQTAEEMAALIREFIEAGLVNAIGSCCGSTPDFTALIAKAARGATPRRPPSRPWRTRLSGLEPLEIGPDSGLVMIGERTNVMGSIKFRRLIEADDWQAATAVALAPVLGGGNLIDSIMDRYVLRGERSMTLFLNL